MKPGQVAADRIIAAFRQETRWRRTRMVTSSILLVLAALCGFQGLICKAIGLPGGLVWMLLSLIGVIGASVILAMQGRSEGEAFRQITDARAAGALIERLELSFGAEKSQVIGLLTNLLTRFGPSDAALLAMRDRSWLKEALRLAGEGDLQGEAEFLIAVLHINEHIGDETSLSIVAALAENDGNTISEQKVRDAARRCLPILRARLQQYRRGAQLLRPVESSEDNGLLLRPTSGVGQAESFELLRPGEQTER